MIHRVSWTGRDPDGGPLNYLVAVNPRSLDLVDDTWTATADPTRVLRVKRAEPLAAGSELTPAREFDVIAVRAKDREGALSDWAARAFFADNIAPTVTITSPRPGPLFTPVVPPTLRIQWQGIDPDGLTGRPVRYKFKLIRDFDPEYALGVSNPDSLRRLYAPNFAGWDSTSADTTEVTYTNLSPHQQYLFVLTAIDDRGAYDPIFSLSKNLLRFRVAEAGTSGPRLTLFNETFRYSYPTGGFHAGPAYEVPIAAPAKIDFTVRWFGEPTAGTTVTRYRWALDIADLFDETPRRNRKDLDRWSAWSADATSATFELKDKDPAEHRLYVEAEDNVGFVSLGIARIRVVAKPHYDRELLIVDDTRLRPDGFTGGVLRPPVGPWPTAAELDSFLYARGGFPWAGYPAGTISQPGIFDGYDFDTLGTRTGLADPTVPLEVLNRYRQVVWMVDAVGATYSRPGTDPLQPISALRYMTQLGRQNPLALYLEQGGRLWILGGGAGYAATITRNFPGNDVPTPTFSSLGARPELVPSAFMWEYPHWRSEFRIASASPTIELPPFAIGEGHHAPDYDLFPPRLDLKSPATDPLPPLRTNPSDFYRSISALEFLQKPNEIEEDRAPAKKIRLESALDTIYTVRGPGLPPQGPDPGVDRIVTPVMTCYRGGENGQVLFSGFDLWSWRRTQCVQLVDAVLQGVWKLRKSGAVAAVATGEPEFESKHDRKP